MIRSGWMRDSIWGCLFVVLFFGACHLSLKGQTKVLSEAKRFYEEAQQELRRGNYEQAVHHAQDATRISRRFTEAFILLGTAYQKMKRYKESIHAYKRALHLEPLPEIEYRIAESYLFLEEYVQAEGHYRAYLDSNPSSRKTIQKVKKRLKTCAFAVKAVQNPVPFDPISLSGLNSQSSEYNPVISADGSFMIYTKMIRSRKRLQEDFYISYRKKDGAWTSGVPLPGRVNSPDNEGGHTISIDGKEMYLTACNRKRGLGSCDIYRSVYTKEGWSAPVNLGRKINSRSWDAQPSLSADGKQLYFSSDRAGGKGKKDLWVSTRVNGSWTTPINLAVLNSSGNELSPFIHMDDRTLYFSSDGWEGMGSKDLFIARKKRAEDSWNPPENMGYRINSTGEEYSIFVDRNGHTAYIATDNLPDTKGGLDIYSFELSDRIASTKGLYLEGRITNRSRAMVRNARMAMYHTETGKNISVSVRGGFFRVILPLGQSYGMQVYAKGYMLHSERFTFSDDGGDQGVVKKDVELLRISTHQKMVLENIHFRSNESQLDKSSYTELDNLAYFLLSQPDVTLQVNGHTDNLGGHKFNMNLSVSRAKSVVDYLVSKGVKLPRLKYKGFGEKVPLYSNDSDEGRRKNRRTEVVIL